MDVFDVTPKKLFLLKLRNEPIMLDVTDLGDDGWATKEQLEHLWNLGVMKRLPDGKARVTHHLISILRDHRTGKIEYDHTPAGYVLGKK